MDATTDDTADWLREIGRRVCENRERADKGHETLARETRLSAAELQELEAGRLDVSVSGLRSVALALDIELGDLLGLLPD